MTKFSIIIPCFNEKNTIVEIIKQVQKVSLLNIEKEIIVVDDGSTDGTRELVAKLPGIKYFFHDKNLGKGGAVKTGFREATGEIVIIQDADLEYDPNEYSAMIAPILNGDSEIVLGVRIFPNHDLRRRKSNYWLAWLGNHCITWLTNILYGNWAGEYEGGYKAFTKKLIDCVSVKTNDFDFDNELICKILKLGHKTADVPIHYHPRGYLEGKKINYKHGVKILWTILKYRFID
ncbi:MAG: glycosyltransferase family 2 protein [Patescibacteria group bacterium]